MKPNNKLPKHYSLTEAIEANTKPSDGPGECPTCKNRDPDCPWEAEEGCELLVKPASAAEVKAYLEAHPGVGMHDAKRAVENSRTPPERPADSAREPLIGWMILEDHCEDMSDWSGVISFPDPTGANLSWENPTKMIEYSAYESACKERDAIAVQRDDWLRHEQSQYESHIHTDKERVKLKAEVERLKALNLEHHKAIVSQENTIGKLREALEEITEGDDHYGVARAALEPKEDERAKLEVSADGLVTKFGEK